jgi:hypothetical protein
MPSCDVSRSRKRKASLSPRDPMTASPNCHVATAILIGEPISSGGEKDLRENKEPRHVDR